MRKVILLLTLTILFSLLSTITLCAQTMTLQYDGKSHEYTAEPIKLNVNGKDLNLTMPPIVFNESTVVPAREVFEALGAVVSWDDKTNTAAISYNNTKISLVINQKVARVNDNAAVLDIPPKIINEKTMIPTRFVSEQLGFLVNWDEKTRTIFISNKEQSNNGSGNTPGSANNSNGSNANDATNTLTINNIKYIRNPVNGLVSNVSTDSGKNKIVEVDIEASNVIEKYNSFTLKDPDRLVIDINDAVLNISNKEIPVNENGIQSIRTAQFNVNPNTTRVVVDLANQMKRDIYLSSDKKHLLVDFTLGDNTLKNGKYTVVIDPGHGGSEPGAIYGGIDEKVFNLDIALKLKKLLEDEGINVVMTREDDSYVDLYARSDLANQLNADLLVSIHNNALADTSYGGTMTLYDSDIKPTLDNKTFADIMEESVVAKTGTINRGESYRPNLAVLRTSNVPAVIVEVAFMTNDSDMSKLKTSDFQELAAEGLRDGIIKSLNSKNN